MSEESTQRSGRVLIVDDEYGVRRAVERILSPKYEVLLASGPFVAIEMLQQEAVDACVVDVKMPGMTGIELTERIRTSHPDVQVVVMTAEKSQQVAVDAMRAGAYDFVSKPFDPFDIVTMTVDKAVERRRLLLRARDLESRVALGARAPDIVGDSESMQKLLRTIETVAPTDATVLIYGETGTGKELVARAIHKLGKRGHKGIFVINCGALTESLLDSELFGHVKGAFTGAATSRRGIFEAADGATVFLDEIGEMSPSSQVRLLRVLQDGEVRPVGSNSTRRVDCRIIAATHVDLVEAVKSGDFRDDLYYRFKVVSITVPPLRERRFDIPLLAAHFLERAAKRFEKPVSQIAPEAVELLARCSWPGNVRQLEAAIKHAVVFCPGDILTLADLPEDLAPESRARAPSVAATAQLPYKEAREEVIRHFERSYVEALLSETGGTLSEAARRASMDRSNFRRLVSRLGIDPRDYFADGGD